MRTLSCGHVWLSLFQALLFDQSCVFKAQCTVLDRITALLGQGICLKVDSSRHSLSIENICMYIVHVQTEMDSLCFLQPKPSMSHRVDCLVFPSANILRLVFRWMCHRAMLSRGSSLSAIK